MTIYEQIQKSVDYIEANLFDKLTFEQAARSAFMSGRNFYHYFWAVTGYSYKKYVIKRRLTEAMKILSGSREKILDIALHVGYESHEAFTRAFKSEFGISPSLFRKNLQVEKGLEKIILIKEMYMGVVIKQLPDMKAICFEGFAPDPEKEAREKMDAWFNKRNLKNTPHRIFGHNIDLDGNSAHNPENIGYKFIVAIDDDPDLSGDSVKTEIIKAGKFVVTGIEGSTEPTPGDNWITKGWEKLQKMIRHKDYKLKSPVRWFEEELEPSKPGNLRLDLYLEIE